MKILVVDDFSTIRKIIRKMLLEIGYRDVAESSDGEEAVIWLETNTADFIVTDWNMPGISGLQLLQHIRNTPEIAHIPVLMVTAESDRDHIFDAAQLGVSGYIVKPFTAATLKEKIENILERKSVHADN